MKNKNLPAFWPQQQRLCCWPCLHLLPTNRRSCLLPKRQRCSKSRPQRLPSRRPPCPPMHRQTANRSRSSPMWRWATASRPVWGCRGPLHPTESGLDYSANFEGYPDQSYIALVAQGLGLDRQHAIDLGLPGLMSADLLDMVRDSGTSQPNQATGSTYTYPSFRTICAKPTSSPSRSAPTMRRCPASWGWARRPTGRARSWLN